MAEDSRVLPDLKDIETKMGRKVPESLVRSLVAGKRHEEREKPAARWSCRGRSKSADVERLEAKLLFLKQEMVSSPRHKPRKSGDNPALAPLPSGAHKRCITKHVSLSCCA